MNPWIIVLAVAIALTVLDDHLRRRRVERLAELAGLERFPGESIEELERRAAERYPRIDGGPRR